MKKGALHRSKARHALSRVRLLIVAVVVGSAFAFAQREMAPPPTIRVMQRDWHQRRVTYDTSWPPAIQDSRLPQLFWIPLPNGRDSFPNGWAGFFRLSYKLLNQGTIYDHGFMRNVYFQRDTFSFGPDVIHVNPSLFPGSIVFEAQQAQQTGEPAPVAYSRYCTGADLTALKDDVLAHEGAMPSRFKSHAKEFAHWFAPSDEALRHPVEAMQEQIAFRFDPNDTTGVATVMFDTTFMRAGLGEAFTANTDIVHAPSNLIPAPRCKLRVP